MKILLSAVAVFAAALSLFRKPKPGVKKIKKGKSYSTIIPKLHLGVRIANGKFTLSEKSKYKPHTKPQINKIVGLGWGFHHKNSIRIGEMINSDGTFTLYAYGYLRGYRFYEPLTVTNCVTMKYALGYYKKRLFVNLFDENNNPLSAWSFHADITVMPGAYLNFYHENAPSDVEVYTEIY
jgi:hypothetical protein